MARLLVGRVRDEARLNVGVGKRIKSERDFGHVIFKLLDEGLERILDHKGVSSKWTILL